MLRTKKSQTINAGAFAVKDGAEVQVASMYASLDEEGNRTENCTIMNKELYVLYRDEVEAEIAEFRAMASALTN